MNTHQPDFASLDMRRLKVALVERAEAERVSVSVIVHQAVARQLGVAVADSKVVSGAGHGNALRASTFMLSIRLTTGKSDQLAADKPP